MSSSWPPTQTHSHLPPLQQRPSLRRGSQSSHRPTMSAASDHSTLLGETLTPAPGLGPDELPVMQLRRACCTPEVCVLAPAINKGIMNPLPGRGECIRQIGFCPTKLRLAYHAGTLLRQYPRPPDSTRLSHCWSAAAVTPYIPEGRVPRPHTVRRTAPAYTTVHGARSRVRLVEQCTPHETKPRRTEESVMREKLRSMKVYAAVTNHTE